MVASPIVELLLEESPDIVYGFENSILEVTGYALGQFRKSFLCLCVTALHIRQEATQARVKALTLGKSVHLSIENFFCLIHHCGEDGLVKTLYA